MKWTDVINHVSREIGLSAPTEENRESCGERVTMRMKRPSKTTIGNYSGGAKEFEK